ncbi:hypothetical protein GCM10017044_10990 [Kordiimonas sediminis]|uniref:Uncharacterized protein n=1 Tax=Kordiimonas sediminis TaxID=1735581 RepID=A0A919AQE0_9PROT|nr:hypothetical protein [Kordiimonas sediminis]GHF18280.1 hypothetical protein GCM10017044_10990 [Kordiimonas sediminis]
MKIVPFLSGACRPVCARVYQLVWTDYFLRIFVWISQGLNTLLGPLFNAVLFLEAALRGKVPTVLARFGFPDETLSSVFGKNRQRSLWCAWAAAFLDFIDRGHAAEAIEYDEGSYWKTGATDD